MNRDPIRRPAAATRRRAATLLLLTPVLLAASCGAPASVPVEGPVADRVAASLAGGTERFDHSEWDRLLAAGTRDGLVDYVYFQDHRAELDAYLGRLDGVDLGRLAPRHLAALLMNAYNAYTILTILEHPRVSSIREIDGAWTEATHRVGGFELTLDTMEHNLLRPFFRDPRVHFAVNCASRSCAPLPPWAFTGERLEEQLEERTRAFLTDERNVRVEGDRLVVSRYFDWYGDDFVADGWEPRAETVAQFIARYASPGVGELVRQSGGSPELEYQEYDWSLNAAVPPDPER